MKIVLLDDEVFENITKFTNIGVYIKFLSDGEQYKIPWTAIKYIRGKGN